MTLTTVWGSGGSGKSLVTLALGAALSHLGEDTLILSTDPCTPSLALYLPRQTQLQGRHSLGGLLDHVPVQDDLKDRIHPHPQENRLYFLGHVSGEAPCFAYPAPERGALAGLFHLLEDSPFAHVLIDGCANPVYDPLTLYGLEYSRHVVRVVTPDVKGAAFLEAQLSWMQGSEHFHLERHLGVCNLAYPFSPVEEAKALCGPFLTTLPYAEQAAQRMAAGELLRSFTQPQAIHLEQALQPILSKLKEPCHDHE